jgi:hypothetical protein
MRGAIYNIPRIINPVVSIIPREIIDEGSNLSYEGNYR